MNAFQSLGQVNSIASEISLSDCPLRKSPRYSKIAKARSVLREAAFSLTGMIGTVIKNSGNYWREESCNPSSCRYNSVGIKTSLGTSSPLK